MSGFVQESDVLYLDPNKKRTNAWLKSLRVTFPSGTTKLGSLGMITYPNGKVNIQGVPFSKLTGATYVSASETDDVVPEWKKKLQNLNRKLAESHDGVAATENKNTALWGGVEARYSLKDRIKSGMTDEQRYEILKGRTVAVPRYNTEKMATIEAADYDQLQRAAKSEAFGILRKIGEQFGVFKEYHNIDIDIDFGFSKRKLQESLSKQNGKYQNYAKMMSVFDEVVEGAIGIETHTNRYEKKGEQVKDTFVFTSAFEVEDGGIIPVLLEVREFTDNTKSVLYIAVSMHKIEKGRIVVYNTADEADSPYTLPASVIKIADLFTNVNLKDGRLLKYIPDGFLDAEQRTAKRQALVEQEDYIKRKNEGKNNAEYSLGKHAGGAAAMPENKNTAQQDGGSVRFSKKTVNGNLIAWIENSGLSAKQLRDHEAVANYIASHIGEVYTIIESGQKVYIGEDLPAEYTQSKYTSYLKNRDPKTLRAKNRATSGLGDMIEIATNRRWEKTKHTHSKDAKYGMYRYDSSFAFPVKDRSGTVTDVYAYDVELLIRNASDGKKYLYDIVNIKNDTASAIDLLSRETRKGGHTAASQGSANKSVAQETGKSNQRFSLKTPVEQTKTLLWGGVEARYSISGSLKNDLQKVLDGTFYSQNNEVYIGETSNFLTETIGADALHVTMPASKAYSAMVTAEQARKNDRYKEDTHYHGLGADGLLKALEASENPVAVFADTGDEKSKRTGNIVLVTDAPGTDGNIVVVETLGAKGSLNGKRIKANKVITSYDRRTLASDIMQAAADGRLLHLDKKRSQQILAGEPAANPQGAIRDVDFEKNIQDFWANVKWKKSGTNTYSVGDTGIGKSAFAQAYEKALHTDKQKDAPQRGAGSLLPSHLNGSPFADSTAQDAEKSNSEERRSRKGSSVVDAAAARAEDAESTSVDTNPATHTPQEQAVIKEYQNAADPQLVEYFNGIDKGNIKGYYQLKPVSNRAAKDILGITGKDVAGFETRFDAKQMYHIKNDHGTNGKADRSMKDSNDIGRIQYVLDNYDSVEDGGRTDAYWEKKPNGHNGQARTVVFKKKVNGTYYVVEAVPITKARSVYIVSAYMNEGGKKRGAKLRLLDAEASWSRPDTPNAHDAPTDTVPQLPQTVNPSIVGKTFQDTFNQEKERQAENTKNTSVDTNPAACTPQEKRRVPKELVDRALLMTFEQAREKKQN